MRLPWPFRRNQRWIRQVDAYVDDRLTPIERELLEDRVEESPVVRRELDRTWALKQELNRMPAHPAPRSFAITPAMLERTAPVPPPRAAAVTLRLAQGTAFGAVAALMLTAGVHVGGFAEEETADQQAPAANMEAAGAGEDAGGADDSASPAEDASGMAGDADGAAGDGNGSLAPSANGGGESAGGDGDSAPELYDSSDEKRAGEAREGSETGLAGDDSGSAPDFAPLYAALTAVLALAAGAWLVLRRQLRASRPA